MKVRKLGLIVDIFEYFFPDVTDAGRAEDEDDDELYSREGSEPLLDDVIVSGNTRTYTHTHM